MTRQAARGADARDIFWMGEALRLAGKGRPFVSPNPMVGACIVRQGRLVTSGWHERFGGDHAEVAALRKAGKKAKGATLYVTLEPCSTWGKTPPCIEAILQAGIRRVVIGASDPDSRHRGRGLRLLRKKGITVKSGLLAAEVRLQNEAFFKHASTGVPFVTLKMAQTLDGKIASRTGHSRWITSIPARNFVHSLRAEHDAILVGKNTLLQDDPFLSPRLTRSRVVESKPWRIALDPRLEVSPKARIFQGKQLTILAVSEKTRPSRRWAEKKGLTLIFIKEKKGRLDLRDLLGQLGKLGVGKLLVEGGGELAWSFLEQRLVDRFLWILAPKFMGGRQAPTSVGGEGVRRADEAIACEAISVHALGEDLLLEGKVKRD